MSTDPLYFVHISDTHFGPTEAFELYGSNAYRNAERIVATINALPVQPDFVVHTGDIVSNPDDAAYERAAALFARLKSPVYYVVGNHDLSKKIHAFLPAGERESYFADDNFLSYSFEKKGYRFIALDARGPDEIDPHGVLTDAQFQFLEHAIGTDDMPLVLFVHFPPLKLDAKWFDESMLLLNGERLHQALRPVRDRVRGVFFGHVHRGMQILRDGILYSSVASTIGQFTAWPQDETVRIDADHPPSYNFVTLIDGQTIIKEHTLPKRNI